MSGFTLIELVVTFVLLALLVALGLPSFTAWIRNSQVRTVAEALQIGIRTAQAEAVRRNRQVVMSFTNSNPGLGATAVAKGKNWSLQTVPQFGETEGEFISGGALSDIASGVTIEATPPATSPTAICFNASGRLSEPTDTHVPDATCSAARASFDVTQTNADRPLRVIVQIGGQLRMCDPHRPALSSAAPDGCPP